MKTQKSDVLQHLMRHGSLTRIQAIYDLGVIELSSRIGELEKDGYQIPRKPYTGTASNGRRYRSVRYMKPVVPL